MKPVSLFIISLTLPLFLSCISEPTLPEDRAVIDGWFDSDGYPVVVFTSSFRPADQSQKVSDKIIRWGKVTISDGERTVIMTGAPAPEYFPPYRYYTFEMKGEPGKTYTLTADFKDLHASAVCTMPEPTPIDSIRVKPIEGSDSLRAATLYFTSPLDTPAYYYLTVRENKPGTRPLPAMLGTLKATEGGQKMSIPVFNPKNHLDTVHFVPQLKIGQDLEISLNRVSEEVFNFWSGYDNSVLFGNSQFLSNSNSESNGNITGGYGIWSVQGTSKKNIIIE